MPPKVLCVDDDASVLEAFRRTLRKDFSLSTAQSGEEGLQVIAREGPFAVVLSDQRMPGMGGVQFLRRVRDIAPESVRMMLTGDAEQQTAADAVNQGHIFRFLTKPIAASVLTEALYAAAEQYRLITAERVLLEDTLKASIKVLVDILSLTNPLAFNRAMRIRDLVVRMARAMALPDAWQYDMAAMLSQIGSVTVPAPLLEQYYSGKTVAPADLTMLQRIPSTSSKLIAGIPRLEKIAAMIAHQSDPSAYQADPSASGKADPVRTGAELLKTANDYDLLLARGISPDEAVTALATKPEVYPPAVVQALRSSMETVNLSDTRSVRLEELADGMIIAEDVKTGSGMLLVSRGHQVTEALRHRLRNYQMLEKLPPTVRVVASSSPVMK
jgi:response regulator RpfG family c-di-GMP phosphodiesterase